MPTCPSGHRSGNDEWCEECGLRIEPAMTSAVPAVPPPPGTAADLPRIPDRLPPAAPPPPPPPGAAADLPRAARPVVPPGRPSGDAGGAAPADPRDVGRQEGGYPSRTLPDRCPRCGTFREMDAAFCEECRYQFAARPEAPSGFPAPSPPYPPLSQRTTSSPSQLNRPAEPLPPLAVTRPDSGDFLLPPPIAPGRAPSTEQSIMPPAAPPPPAPFADAPGSADEPGSADPWSADPWSTDSWFGEPGEPHVSSAAAEHPDDAAPDPADPDDQRTWTAVVSADREYFATMMARGEPDAAELHFPHYVPELRVPLTGDEVTIGRRRHATGETPDIDLSQPPEDPGVSHRHAVLARRPDGGWSVVDQNSTNGTTVNDAEEAIPPFRPVALAEGDRVHVGAWTTITLRRE